VASSRSTFARTFGLAKETPKLPEFFIGVVGHFRGRANLDCAAVWPAQFAREVVLVAEKILRKENVRGRVALRREPPQVAPERQTPLSFPRAPASANAVWFFRRSIVRALTPKKEASSSSVH